MIVLIEAHAMIGLRPGNSPAPIPNLAYVVSDEGSISRFATSIPTYKTKQSLIWRRGWMREMSVLGLDLSRCYSELGLVFGSLRCSVEKDKHDSRC